MKKLLIINYSLLILLIAPTFSQSALYEKTDGAIDIPLDNPYATYEIRRYADEYLKSENTIWIYNTLEEAEIYRLYVRKRLAEEKMPWALEYLPVVESNYKATAVSRSGATGVWQFMENSIAGLLKKDEWVDERRDPFLSTDAAIRKLKDNYNFFGDWLLALAAYNCGAGALRKILKTVEKPENKNFWYISLMGILRDESTNYVPKFLAISDIVKHSSEYGIEMPDTTIKEDFYNKYQFENTGKNGNSEKSGIFFEYIEVKKSVPLARLSSDLKMDDVILEKLNPALVKKATPPYKYNLRIPSGMKEQFLLIFSEF